MRHVEPSAVQVSLSVYRWLLRAYPPAFRERYGDEMARVFRDTALAAWQQDGHLGLLNLWCRTLSDTMRNATSERIGACRIDIFWRRTLALVGDRGITFALLIGYLFVSANPWLNLPSGFLLWQWPGSTNVFVAFGCSFVYGLPCMDHMLTIAVFVVCRVARYGRTPGMEACGLCVLSMNGEPVRWPRILLWHLASHVSGLALGLGYLWALIDPEGRTWHDIVAGVRVCRATEEVQRPA